MTRETIKEYILQVKSQDGTEALYNRWEPDILVEVINEIFNYHEAQLNAKNKEIEKYKSLHNLAKGSLNKASDYTRLLEKQLKAKDEKIKKLKIDLQDYIDQQAGEDL